jgi:uroporphyrinogen-III synthase
VRVIITRPEEEGSRWAEAIEATGFRSWSLPLIEVGPTVQGRAVDQAWSRLGSFDAVMFVSRNAAKYFFARKPSGATVFSAQAAVKTVAFVTGPGSFATLKSLGAEQEFVFAPDLSADRFDSEALWDVVKSRIVVGYRVLIVRGVTLSEQHIDSDHGTGRDWFAQRVREAGGEVEFVVSYERTCPKWDDNMTALAADAGRDGSVWIFSSSEAIRNLQLLCPDSPWDQARAVVTHPRIATAARAAGFRVVLESKPVVSALLASIESLQ